jgi:hypothetical protein
VWFRNGFRAGAARGLRRYLGRHVELDEGEHGPSARALLIDLCAEDPVRWKAALHAASTALSARRALWDGVVRTLEASAQDRPRALDIQ